MPPQKYFHIKDILWNILTFLFVSGYLASYIDLLIHKNDVLIKLKIDYKQNKKVFVLYLILLILYFMIPQVLYGKLYNYIGETETTDSKYSKLLMIIHIIGLFSFIGFFIIVISFVLLSMLQ